MRIIKELIFMHDSSVKLVALRRITQFICFLHSYNLLSDDFFKKIRTFVIATSFDILKRSIYL